MKVLVLLFLLSGFSQAAAQCDGSNQTKFQPFELLGITDPVRPVGWFKGPSALESGFATYWNSPAQISFDVFGIRKLPDTALSVLRSATSIALLVSFDRNNEKHWQIKKAGGTRREYISSNSGYPVYFRYFFPPENFSDQDSAEIISLLLMKCPFHLLQSPLHKSSGVYTSGIGKLIRIEGETGTLDVNVYLKRGSVRFYLDGEYLGGGILIPEALESWKRLINAGLS